MEDEDSYYISWADIAFNLTMPALGLAKGIEAMFTGFAQDFAAHSRMVIQRRQWAAEMGRTIERITSA